MRHLLLAHSGLRYVVLFLGATALVFAIAGLVTGRPLGRTLRILAAAFLGALDLQVLLGAALVAAGIYYPALIGHIVAMLLALSVAHVLLVIHRRRSKPGWGLPVLAFALALGLLGAGIAAIGRGLLEARAFG